jgi:hypothetical protein
MGERAAHHDRVFLSGVADIVRIAARAGEKAVVFLAAHWLADTEFHHAEVTSLKRELYIALRRMR